MDKKLMLATANALIKENGKKVKVTHLDGSTSSAYGVLMRPSQKLLDNSSITVGSMVCMLQGSIARTPAPGDIIRSGLHQWMIEVVDKVQPDGVLTYVYTCGVRQ